MTNVVRGADSIVAGEVSVRATAVRSISAGEVDIKQSAVQRVTGDDIEIEQSSVALVTGARIELEGGSSFVVVGRDIHMKKVNTVLLLAPRVRGEVRTVFDWKSAVAVGVGVVLTRRLLKLLGLG